MTKISKTIVFFGSGPVAAKSLELLLKNFSIEAVVTKPKKSSSRDPVPVIEVATKFNLKIYTPSNGHELDTLIKERPFKSGLGILIDFGIIVSQNVIDYFIFGIINSHFSLLPRWRGPDPISYSILNGDKISGVSLMLLTKGVDEGKLLAQQEINITGLDSIELTDRLIKLSDEKLQQYVPLYLTNKVVPFPQSDKIGATYSKKLSKADGEIDWHKSAKQIENEIKAYIHWPKSYTTIFGIPVIITAVNFNKESGRPSQIYFDKKTMNVKCRINSLDILRLKPAGKNEMGISAFIAGYKDRFKI